MALVVRRDLLAALLRNANEQPKFKWFCAGRPHRADGSPSAGFAFFAQFSSYTRDKTYGTLAAGGEAHSLVSGSGCQPRVLFGAEFNAELGGARELQPGRDVSEAER